MGEMGQHSDMFDEDELMSELESWGQEDVAPWLSGSARRN